MSDMTDSQNAAFERVANAINDVVRTAVKLNLPILLQQEDDSEGVGHLIVGAIAGMLSAAGAVTASFEPHIDGDVIADRVVRDQFNDGRADWFAHMRSGKAQ